jgi:AcrR family transcriptional regulator
MPPLHKTSRSDFEASRLRFIEAAGRVYVQTGYTGSTIRAITAEAGTSLARLNRHWTGKQDLFRDVFALHFTPIHDAQNARLDALEAAGRQDDLRAVLDAFLSPALLGNVGSEAQRTGHLVYCRALVDPAPEANELVSALIAQVQARVIALIGAAMPNLTTDRFFLCIGTVMGAFIYPQVLGPRLARRMDVDFQAIDWLAASSFVADMLYCGLGGVRREPAGAIGRLSNTT